MIKIHLSRLLGERRWSQADLARRTGIRPTTIGEMYHDFILRVTMEHLNQICNVLGCQIGELIEHIPDEPSGENHLATARQSNRKNKKAE